MKGKCIMLLGVLALLTGCGLERNQERTTEELTAEEITDTSAEMSTEEAKQEENTSEEERKEQEEIFTKAKILHKYGDILTGFFVGRPLDDIQLEYMESEEDPNRYAIYDVDGDGREELIIFYTESSMAGMGAWVYDYYVDTDEVIQEISEFPALTFYSNGAIKADWSHNQGLGPNFWPHNLYSYDSSADSYLYEGSVDTWDKQCSETDYDGTLFPDELDTDGDGILYYLDYGASDGEHTTANQAEYEVWYQSVVGNASELEIPWKLFDAEEIFHYGDEYLAMLKRKVEEMKTTDIDIGLSFWQNNSDIEVIGKEITDNTEILLEKSDNPDVLFYTGTLDGIVVYESYDEDGGSVSYCEKGVENVSLFGVYPGISEDEAKKLLNERGFYLNDYNIYVTGEGFGNYGIYLNSEDGTVNCITIMNYTRYAG